MAAAALLRGVVFVDHALDSALRIAAGPLKIHGLDQDTASRLVDELTANTQATQEDGT